MNMSILFSLQMSPSKGKHGLFVLPGEQLWHEVPFVQAKNNLPSFPSPRETSNLIWKCEYEPYLRRVVLFGVAQELGTF